MAKEPHLAPIIIVKKHGKHKHAHHGGSWKVAFADFAVAMMAFFLVMWLTAGTTKEEREQAANYFNNPELFVPIHSQPGSLSSSLVVPIPMLDAPAPPAPPAVNNTLELLEQQRLEQLKEEVEQDISETESLQPFKDQIMLDILPEGLRIQLIDSDKSAMFHSGGSDLNFVTAEILKKLGLAIDKVGNKISITGHTDAKPFTQANGLSNWELSTERANAARRSLVAGGLGEDKIARIVGLGPTGLFNPQEPFSPSNRRISIIVLNAEKEPLPPMIAPIIVPMPEQVPLPTQP